MSTITSRVELVEAGFEVVALNKLVRPVEAGGPVRGNEEFTYIDLSSVDAATKHVMQPRRLATAAAPSRARQRVRVDDVLVSTVRPNLNGVAMVPAELDRSIASTGFCVLRADHEVLDPRYLFHWVRGAQFVATMVRNATGASYPAVTDAIVRESAIPLPPLPEQRRIAAILDQVDELRAKRRRALEHLDELADATFSHMFGNVVANERGWSTVPVSEFVAGFESGKSLVGARDDVGTLAAKVLKVSSVTSGTFDPSASKPLPSDYEPPRHHFVNRGDLLFSRANTSELVGATALVLHPVQGLTLPDKLWRFVWRSPSVCHPVFVWKMFSRPEFRRLISERSTGSSGSMKNVSQSVVLGLPAVLPPLELQQEFSAAIGSVQVARIKGTAHLAKLDELFAALQHRAFRGEL